MATFTTEKQRTKEAFVFYFQGMLMDCDVNLMRASNAVVCLSPLKFAPAPVLRGQKSYSILKCCLVFIESGVQFSVAATIDVAFNLLKK